jgi:histone H3/H4
MIDEELKNQMETMAAEEHKKTIEYNDFLLSIKDLETIERAENG